MLTMVNDYRNYATCGTTGFLVQNPLGKSCQMKSEVFSCTLGLQLCSLSLTQRWRFVGHNINCRQLTLLVCRSATDQSLVPGPSVQCADVINGWP